MAQQTMRNRGTIQELPSGSLRVRVFAGDDPVTGKRHYLTEVIPAGPRARREAERARTRLLAQVEERRSPRTGATVAELMRRHLEMLDVVPTTMTGYEGYVRLHIDPLIGKLKVGSLDADVLDSFYAELRRCRVHCNRKPYMEHHSPDPEHRCDKRCKAHECVPLSNTTLRQVHFLLNGAFKRAVRWRWVAANPVQQADPPAARRPDPHPPSAEEAARIVNAAWESPDWGTFIWMAIVTGARRGELCALRWSNLNLDRAVLTIRQSIADGDDGWYFKDTKTHQQRRVALDATTVELLVEHRERYLEQLAFLDAEPAESDFLFSPAPHNSTFVTPSSVTRRYGRLAERLGINTTLHALRHYSATEMISAGVDVRTVTGRLGHSGGGITTLRVYSAWRDEADQRAAAGFSSWMPSRPMAVDLATRAQEEPRYPYEVVAADIRRRILSGELKAGEKVPMLGEWPSSTKLLLAP